MADYYHGGRTMSYSNTDECYDGRRHGHGHGGRTMSYSDTDECYDAGRHGGGRRVYSNTEECYDGGDRRAYADDGGYGAKQAVYSEEYSRGAGGERGYYKKEEKVHKNREHMGEVGALATGAFAMYEGYEVKKDPAHAQRHKIEAGLAGAAALGAGGYAYHEHREQKEAGYGAKEHGHCYN